MEKMNTERRDDKYTQNLRNELFELLENDIDNAKAERISEIADILTKDDAECSFSEEYLGKKIKQKVLTRKLTEEHKGNKKVHFKIGRILLAVTVMIICLGVASTSLSGKNIFELFRIWDEDVVQLDMASTLPDSTEDFTYYRSIEELEDVLGYNIMSVTYLPNDYQLHSIALNSTTNNIYIRYLSVNNNLAAKLVVRNIDDTNKLFAEISNEKSKVVKQGNIDYFILYNNDTISIQWQDSTFSYNFSGQVSENDTKKIIKNIK